jgi:hypothetical protein
MGLSVFGIIWTKVHIICGMFITSALRLGLIHQGKPRALATFLVR